MKLTAFSSPSSFLEQSVWKPTKNHSKNLTKKDNSNFARTSLLKGLHYTARIHVSMNHKQGQRKGYQLYGRGLGTSTRVAILLCLLVIQMSFCVRSFIIITGYVTLFNEYSSKLHPYSYWLRATSWLVQTFNHLFILVYHSYWHLLSFVSMQFYVLLNSDIAFSVIAIITSK